ncbi:BspA family leucine-rich repeat surface protein, partial [Candidatus Marinimicrobia bacterium]|nr:BspA family leucine-rich repeat surface protein [Candidatus Neomarinimicrobiota bacterium]
WDGTYYYVSHGGGSDNVYRYDEQFNQVDYQFVDIDSRGLVQHPVDGKLYMKNYWSEEFYRLNTDPFDGTAEYLFSLSGGNTQDMFTFSADGQYIITHNSGSLKKYDFSTGQLIESLTLNTGFYNGIANTGNYLLIFAGSNGNTISAHDEQGNYIGDIIFPIGVNSGFGTPSYANGLCFTNPSGTLWSIWDIDDGFITTPGCTDPYADNFDASANEDDGSCAGYPNNGSYSLSFDGVDDYTSLDWSDQLSTYTVSMWVISNAVQQTNYDAFFSTHHPNSSGFQLDTDNGNSLRMLTPDFNMTFTEAIPTYWSHVAVVAETNGAVEKTTIYFNGDSIASVDDVENTWNKIDLGRNRNENSPGNWTVDEVSVWNTARTPAQIQSDMYNAHAGTEEGLLVYWKANAGTGTVLYDHTGNANHATINGATWSTETPILYQPQTTEELQTAVDLWVSDEATALATYGDISVWDVSLITDMSTLFQNKNFFNSDISGWDVSNVTSFGFMFFEASSFNQDLSTWDVSSSEYMQHMFYAASNFNSDISTWDVSNVWNMESMFEGASSFNSDLSSWDVSSVTTMLHMFQGAFSFNSDLSSWDVSSSESMRSMFYNASSFDSDLSTWDVSNVTDFYGMFDGTNISEENKCAIHSSWQSNNNWEYDWSSFCQLCPPSNLAGSPTYNSVSL